MARFGVAFDTYYVNQVDNDEGTDVSGWNHGGAFDVAIARMQAGGVGVQFDARGSFFAGTHGGDDDWTAGYLTGAAHVFAQRANGLLGAFAGVGIAEDTGDTALSQTYWFVGVEGTRQMEHAELFGQLGFLDGNDEYDEGLNQAGFVRVGARIHHGPNTSFMAAISGAFGRQDNFDEPDDRAVVGSLELEVEHAPRGGAMSLFASYQGTLVSFDGGDHQTNFHALMLGLRFRPGAMGVMGGPPLTLAPVDRWFAYTANEVE